MNKDIFRITLTSPLGVLVSPEPDGIQEAPFSLVRDKQYHSVLESLDASLIFNFAAIDFIHAAIDIGIDTELSYLIEISQDYGTTWEDYANGLLDIPTKSTISEPNTYKIKLSTKKDSVWVKAMSREEVSVDVVSVLDVDGNAVAPATLEDIVLSSQVVRRQYRAEMSKTTDDDFVDQIFEFTPTDDHSTLNLPVGVYDEIETTYNYPNIAGSVSGVSLPLIEVKESATLYDFNISIVLAKGTGYNNKLPADFIHPISIVWAPSDGGGPRPPTFFLGRTDFGTNGVDGRSVFTATFTIDPLTFPMPRPPYADRKTIKVGDNFFISIANPSVTDPTMDVYIVPNDIYDQKSFIDIIAHTIFAPSTSKAIRVGEAFDAIIKRITGGDNYYSDFFTTGCGKNFVNMLGLHLRGYDFTQKPFTDSLLERFRAATAVWNLGLGYEKVEGIFKIRIEQLAHFYDETSVSIELSNIELIEYTFKPDVINNQVEIGYSKWQLTSGGSLIDDPQTIHKYNDPFKFVGKSISILCSWIAASLLFELTRRAIEKLNETFDTDNDIFLLHITEDNEPKLDYVVATDLFDPETRYNKELTPGRNFLRWINVLNIGAKEYIGNFFKFVSGLGNFLASIEIVPVDCAGSDVATVTENADIAITDRTVHGIDQAVFTHDLNFLQYKLIRESPNKVIKISQTSSGHRPFFIDKIDFFKFERKANFVLFNTRKFNETGECAIISHSIQNVGGEYNIRWQDVDVLLVGTDVETGTIEIAGGAVVSVATKTTDSGLVTAGSATVEFKLNGTLLDTQVFVLGALLNATYTFTLVQLTDTLETVITEFEA